MSEQYERLDALIRVWLSGQVDDELVSAQISLPSAHEEVAERLLHSGIAPGKVAELVVTVKDTTVRPLSSHLPRNPDLNELNELAHRLAKMDGTERDAFAAVLEAGGNWDTVADLINVAQNLDQFDFYPGAFSAKEFGGIMLETHASQQWEVRERLRASANADDRGFAAYVERLEKSADLVKYAALAQEYEGGALTSTGYLVPVGTSLPQPYTGPKDIPPAHLLTGRKEAPEQKPSLLGAVAAAREKRAADAPEPERNAHTGPEL